MRETQTQGRALLTLDRPQLVGLGFFAILSGGLMFGLGYSAGKNRRGPTFAPDAASALLRIDQKDSLRAKLQQDEAKPDVDLTFYKSLVEQPPKEPRPKVEIQKPVVAKVEVARPDPIKVDAPKLPKAIEPSTEALTNMRAPEPMPLEEAPLVEPSLVEAKPETKAAKAVEKFTIQVSAFKTSGEAASYLKLLQAKGFNAHVTPATVEGKGTWYRVRVGHFQNSAAAETYKQRLTRENVPAWIVKAD